MNLTTDNWIPVVWKDGRADKVSLLDVFQQGDQIRDLAVRPHERIALMRLLICIAQSALDGPKDRDEWKKCWERLPQTAAEYLANWKPAFELFGDGQRFLQTRKLKSVRVADDAKDNLVSKLDMALATGNASTLFDNGGGSQRIFSEANLALMLLTYQNFSPCGIIGAVSWSDLIVPKGTAKHAPCTVGNTLHTIIIKTSLLRTVIANMITREQIVLIGQEWGCPIWQKMPSKQDDHEASTNATNTYLGRLCPLSRLVLLDESKSAVVLGTGLVFPEWREAMATFIFKKEKKERRPMRGSTERAIWRELHAITVLDKDGIGGPLAFSNLEQGENIDIWMCALVAEGNASIADLIESVFSVPTQMFDSQGRLIYQQGVRISRNRERQVKDAVKTYCKSLGIRNVSNKATSHYWTVIEQKVSLLLALVEDPAPLSSESIKDNWGATEWGIALARAARDAYELACPHETPRQLKAYSLGLNVFYKPVETETNEPVTEEID